jgi:hypothetical protein
VTVPSVFNGPLARRKSPQRHNVIFLCDAPWPAKPNHNTSPFTQWVRTQRGLHARIQGLGVLTVHEDHGVFFPKLIAIKFAASRSITAIN